MEKKKVREIPDCFRVFAIRSVHTGQGACVGFSRETPSGLPEGDVIHLCWVGKEAFETSKCDVRARLSFTPEEASKIAEALIRATAFHEANSWRMEMKKE